MAIFSLIAKLGLDGTNFESGLKKSQSMAKGVGREVTGTLAAMFAVDKIAQFGLSIVDAAGQIADLSARLGVSAEFLQEMQFAAKLSGASIEDVAGAVEKLSIARMKALSGDKRSVELLQQMGFSIQQVKEAGGGEGLFMEIGKLFESGIDPQKLVGPFKELAGKGAGALIPAMVSGLTDAAQQARELGIVIDTDVVDALDDVADRIDTLKSVFMSFGASVIAYVVKPFMKYLEATVAGIHGFFMATNTPEGGRDMKSEELMNHMGRQFTQSFISSLEEQDAAIVKRREDRAKRLSMKGKAEESVSSLSEKGLMIQPTDALARTGGFTSFQSNLDKYFGNVKSQAQDIRDISKNTKKTADAVSE
jgi:hypothetical protein